MFNISVPWWEFIVRGIVVYAFLAVMFRITGKRQVGQLAPFDLVLLLILSNAVQNSMNAGDDSLIGGLISATTLICINWVIGYLSYKYPSIEKLLDGEALVLIKDGKVRTKVLEDEHITRAELEMALRHAGAFSSSDVKLAMLETNGQVSVCGAKGGD